MAAWAHTGFAAEASNAFTVSQVMEMSRLALDMHKFIDDRVASISNLMREINEASWQADTTGDSGHQITADEIARQAV